MGTCPLGLGRPRRPRIPAQVSVVDSKAVHTINQSIHGFNTGYGCYDGDSIH